MYCKRIETSWNIIGLGKAAECERFRLDGALKWMKVKRTGRLAESRALWNVTIRDDSGSKACWIAASRNDDRSAQSLSSFEHVEIIVCSSFVNMFVLALIVCTNHILVSVKLHLFHPISTCSVCFKHVQMLPQCLARCDSFGLFIFSPWSGLEMHRTVVTLWVTQGFPTKYCRTVIFGVSWCVMEAFFPPM